MPMTCVASRLRVRGPRTSGIGNSVGFDHLCGDTLQSTEEHGNEHFPGCRLSERAFPRSAPMQVGSLQEDVALCRRKVGVCLPLHF